MFNLLYRQWTSEAQDEAVDRTLIKINKDISKRHEETQKEITIVINKVQADSRRESISTLSIFVALLSFPVASIFSRGQPAWQII